MVHYGHSCLIPIQETQGIKMLYVFVSITINLGHFIDVLKTNFERHKKLALVSTIQFIPSLQVSIIYYIFLLLQNNRISTVRITDKST